MNTDITDLHWRVDQAIKAIIIAEELVDPLDVSEGGTGLTIGEGDVKSQMYPDPLTVNGWPCVLITEDEESEELASTLIPGTSTTKSYVYPVRIWVADVLHPKQHERKRLYMIWRKALMDLFDGITRPLPDVPEIQTSEVVPGIIFDSEMPKYQRMATGFVAKFHSVEPIIRRSA